MCDTNITLSIHPDDVAKIAAIIFNPLPEVCSAVPEVVDNTLKVLVDSSLPEVVESLDVTKHITPSYVLSIIDNQEELQKLCNNYNDAVEKSMKFCKELNECKKTLSWYEFDDDVDDETLNLYKCEEGVEHE
jgi:hypothetical protein